MTPQPAIGAYGEDLYDRLELIHRDADEANNWALRTYVGALGTVHDVVRTVTSDTEAGAGWSALFDPDRCPAAFLPYLAQHFGVRIPVGTPEATARAMIKTPAGFVRGAVGAVLAAVQQTLTGTQYVSFTDRQDNSFWRWLLVTRPSETPDPGATYRALLSQKRAGVIATHVVTDVTLIDELTGNTAGLAGTIDNL